MRSGLLVAVLLGLGAEQLPAQEFHPPPARRQRSGGTRIGLFGFGVRSGVDFTGDRQLVLGAALDAGDLFTSRLRLRPSGEIGVFNGANTYVGNFEALFRFTADAQAAAPYVGTGFGVFGHGGCRADPDCPALWWNVVVGFEVRYRSTFNWLLEYHGLDAFRRSRLYVGLTTRRGN